MILLDINKKEQAILDIKEEINVVLSIKDHISEEEIKNLTEGFKALNERDIRELLVNITGDSIYIENFKEENEIAKKEEVIEEKPLVKEKIIIKLPDTKPKANSENISVIREEVRYNQLCIEWDWPVLIEKVMVCYRNDKFPSKPEDKDSNKFIVEKRMEEKTGEFIINKLKEESYYFWVFPIINEATNIKYLQGKKRLVVNKAVEEINYEFKVKKSLFGVVKSVKIILN